jgi:hypothetical protein
LESEVGTRARDATVWLCAKATWECDD